MKSPVGDITNIKTLTGGQLNNIIGGGGLSKYKGVTVLEQGGSFETLGYVQKITGGYKTFTNSNLYGDTLTAGYYASVPKSITNDKGITVIRDLNPGESQYLGVIAGTNTYKYDLIINTGMPSAKAGKVTDADISKEIYGNRDIFKDLYSDVVSVTTTTKQKTKVLETLKRIPIGNEVSTITRSAAITSFTGTIPSIEIGTFGVLAGSKAITDIYGPGGDKSALGRVLSGAKVYTEYKYAAGPSMPVDSWSKFDSTMFISKPTTKIPTKIITGLKPILTTTQITRTITAPVTITKMGQITNQITKQITVPGITSMSYFYYPPVMPVIKIPKIPDTGGGAGFSFKRNYGLGRATKYTPSLVAMDKVIKGSKSTLKKNLTGWEIRPIVRY